MAEESVWLTQNQIALLFGTQRPAITKHLRNIFKSGELEESSVSSKHNSQYSPIKLEIFTNSHDRFLIIDNKILYHIGASLKDLGKKCFAFEIMDSAWIKEILKNL